MIGFVVNRISTGNLVSMYLLHHIDTSRQNIVSEKFQWKTDQFGMLSPMKRKNTFNIGGDFRCNTLISVKLE